MKLFIRFAVFLFIIFSPIICLSQVNVITQHNNYDRTGWNNRETILNKGNVKTGSFGKLFTRNVDDQLYAQPLIVQQVNIPSVGKKNIVFLATVNNFVYAFDADSANAVSPYWQVNLTPIGERPVVQADLAGACPGNFLSNIGIVGTPVIDTSSNTIYLVARSINPVHSNYSQYLHALDITTGKERLNSPVLITAQVNGTGDANVNGVVHFDAQKNNQRPGLLLLNGVVYIGFSSHCDWTPYHGWLLGYNALSLQQQFVYNDTPDGYNGGIWMSGTAPAADTSGNIYFAIGNGSVGTGNNPANLRNRSESVVRLKPDSLQPIKDFFTPNNYPTLEASDLDLGTSGAMLIPGSNRVVTGCKDGNLYVLDLAHLGGYNATANQALQTINLGNAANMHTQFSYYGGTANEFGYFWPENTALKAIPFTRATGKFDDQNIISSGIPGPVGETGAMLSVSSNGSLDSTAVLWSSAPVNCDGENFNCPGILRAIDASDVTKELWNSGILATDNPGNFAKFSSPTIANGKVYLGTFSNQLIVYGLTGALADTCNSSNIALNKPAFASSLENSKFSAAFAVDGNLNTRWSSAYSDPQSIYFDLGKRFDLCKVILHWETAFGRDFKIEISDDAASWQTLANITGNTSNYNVIPLQGTGRYIRMFGTARATQYGYSLYEFETYGTPSLYSCAPPSQVASGNIYETMVTLSWQKNGGDSFNISYRPANAVSWTNVSTANNSYTLTGLTCGTDYYFKIQSVCSDTAASLFTPVAAFSTLACNSNCGLLPSKWSSRDINNPALEGSACYANGIYTLTASGNDIWDVADQFHFAYATLHGDGSIVTRVSSLNASNPWNKCGIMIRESLDPGSRNAFVACTSENGIAFQYRQTSDALSFNTNTTGMAAPYWIKMVKIGSTFSAFMSADSINWSAVGSSVDLGFGVNSPVYCGLALSSHDNNVLVEATLDHFSSPGFTQSALQSLTGEILKGPIVLLNWITSLEINAAYFIVEKSVDNSHFAAIDSVAAKNGGSIMSNYSSKDNSPAKGINFYRLRIVDVFGNVKYSELVVIRITDSTVPLIYPNPATTSVNILQGSEPIKTIRIFDLSGSQMIVKQNDNNSTSVNIPLNSLARSIYVIEIKTANTTYRNKLVKK